MWIRYVPWIIYAGSECSLLQPLCALISSLVASLAISLVTLLHFLDVSMLWSFIASVVTAVFATLLVSTAHEMCDVSMTTLFYCWQLLVPAPHACMFTYILHWLEYWLYVHCCLTRTLIWCKCQVNFSLTWIISVCSQLGMFIMTAKHVHWIHVDASQCALLFKISYYAVFRKIKHAADDSSYHNIFIISSTLRVCVCVFFSHWKVLSQMSVTACFLHVIPRSWWSVIHGTSGDKLLPCQAMYGNWPRVLCKALVTKTAFANSWVPEQQG